MNGLGALLPALVTAVPGPASARAVDVLSATECPALTSRRARRAERAGAPQDPIVWAQAQGCNVIDADGNRFVDLSAGFGAAAIGHTHPRVVAAVQAQAGKLVHALGDLQPSDVKIQLLQRVAGLAPFADARVMLGLSGGDAVEAALKTALLFTKQPGVIAFEGSYHGLAHGPLAACGYSAAFRAPFAAQLNTHVEFAPYPREGASVAEAIAGVEQAMQRMAAEHDSGVGVVLVEPVLGRGGVVVPPEGFLLSLSQWCQQRGVLLAVDEVMTGLGRAGAMLSCTRQGVQPDLICLGKALGGGLPVSACIGRAQVMRAWGDPGQEALHTGTFFGNPLGAAAALATLDVLEEEQLAARAQAVGARLLAQLRALRARHAAISGVHGAGLLVGVELTSGELALALGRKLLARGYITVPASADARVISLTPPLTISEEQLTGFVNALDVALGEHA